MSLLIWQILLHLYTPLPIQPGAAHGCIYSTELSGYNSDCVARKAWPTCCLSSLFQKKPADSCFWSITVTVLEIETTSFGVISRSGHTLATGCSVTSWRKGGWHLLALWPWKHLIFLSTGFFMSQRSTTAVPACLDLLRCLKQQKHCLAM